MSISCQLSYHTKCQCRGLGGQKYQNLVNVVCERPLRRLICIKLFNKYLLSIQTSVIDAISPPLKVRKRRKKVLKKRLRPFQSEASTPFNRDSRCKKIYSCQSGFLVSTLRQSYTSQVL